MHSIERYGIVALLFLVVTVVAVLMWDGNKEKPLEVPEVAPAAVAPAPRDSAAESEAARLSLVAESQPGPLQRRARAGRGHEGQAALEPRGGAQPDAPPAPALEDAPIEPGAEPTSAYQTPREEPAPEQVIGRLTSDEPLAAPPPSAPAAATHAYTVRPGDTLSEIAQRELGSSRRWQELVAANPGLDPAKLRVGKTIRIPGAKAATGAGETRTAALPAGTAREPASAAKKPASPPAASGKTWKVGKGENLWRIAERALGDGKRWGEIARLNPGVNPDRLLLGQVLVLPAGAAAPSKAGKESATKLASAPPKSSPSAKSKPKSDPVLLASASSGRRGGKVK